MKKLVISETFSEALYHAGKHRMDTEISLQECGYHLIQFNERRSRIFRFALYLKAVYLAILIKRGSIVHFHFPIYSRSKRFLHFLLSIKGVRTQAFIFDLDGFRNQNKKQLKKEMSQLCHFDFVIWQNEKMKHLFNKEIANHFAYSPFFYDYRVQAKTDGPLRNKTNNVAFAGNLEKSEFLKHIHKVSANWHIYGAQPYESHYRNISYYGAIHPDSLPQAMSGSFGLVWDGPSLETCTGPYGSYLRINTPFKMAAYLAAGLPLIVWSESAMADWVKNNYVGIVINNLNDIPERIDSLPDHDYHKMCLQINSMRIQMANGNYLKQILKEIDGIGF